MFAQLHGGHGVCKGTIAVAERTKAKGINAGEGEGEGRSWVCEETAVIPSCGSNWAWSFEESKFQERERDVLGDGAAI